MLLFLVSPALFGGFGKVVIAGYVCKHIIFMLLYAGKPLNL